MLSKSKTTLTCTSNERYVPPLCAFLNSIQINQPDVQIVVRLVNCTNKTIDKIKSNFGDINVIIDNHELSDNRNITNLSEVEGKTIEQLRGARSGFKGVRWLYSQEAAYCSNIKYQTIHELLNKGIEFIVHMDVDTIVRHRFDCLRDAMLGYDIGMYICPEEHMKQLTEYGHKYMGWHAGIIVVNNTDTSRTFIDRVRNRVRENIYDIEADEDEFDYVYNNTDDINILSVDKTYKDNGPVFNVNSHIWSGQSEAKSENRQYINEYEKYKIAI